MPYGGGTTSYPRSATTGRLQRSGGPAAASFQNTWQLQGGRKDAPVLRKVPVMHAAGPGPHHPADASQARVTLGATATAPGRHPSTTSVRPAPAAPTVVSAVAIASPGPGPPLSARRLHSTASPGPGVFCGVQEQLQGKGGACSPLLSARGLHSSSAEVLSTAHDTRVLFSLTLSDNFSPQIDG